MFNFLKNKKPDNPLNDVFNDLSKNQKMSVLNFLSCTARADGQNGDYNLEAKLLNTYHKSLAIKGSPCLEYLKIGGQKQLVEDLMQLSLNQKEMLAILSYELMTCDGRINEEEMTYVAEIFERLGIEPEEFSQILKKAIDFNNRLT